MENKMKLNSILMLLISLAVTACASTTQTKSPDAIIPAQTLESAPDKGAAGATADTSSAGVANQQQEIQKNSVYFDFDNSIVKPDYREIIRQQAELLKANAGTVTLEGNSDERGSSEYNLALGDKRAHAVRKAMLIFGVNSDQMNVVSFGEENPRATCHEEKCWSENRRVDFNEKPVKP
jgi:peptidoglycan-associated lipoprotein